MVKVKKSSGSKKKSPSKKKTPSKKKASTKKKTSTKKKASTKEVTPAGPCVADFDSVFEELDEMRKQITTVKHRFQDLAKYARKLEKQVNKIEQKKADRLAKIGGKPRARGGIMKQVPISDELCTFLGVDEGTELTRNDVRNMINSFATENDLKEGTQITLEKGLETLFPDLAQKEETLAYNKIIGELGPHFVQ